MANHRYIKINDLFSGMDKLYEKGLTKGLYCGFNELYQHYSPKLGGHTFWFGHPFSGKTELALDIQINLSKTMGLKHFVYTPETGTPEEIALELISKAACEPIYDAQFVRKMPIETYYYWRDWVGEHFYIVDPTEDAVMLREFYEDVETCEKENGIKITTTLCDPFNELKHEMNDSRQDLYLEGQFGEVLRNAKKHKRHNMLITHTSRQDVVKGQTVDGAEIYYYPPPTPHQVSGGLAWHRKAMNLLSVWRPPKGIILNGQTFEDNEAHITIHKFKPKGTGQKGTIKLFYDTTKNGYYELENGQRRYAGKQPEKPAYAHSGASDVNF